MPLKRNYIQNEYSLANPELLSSTPKDDPNAALEGVAIFALVGLVRQLGSLAEFAAGLFHDLHVEIMATAARNHDLALKVRQLETKLPYFEKAFFSETNQLRFTYKTGAEWHSRVFIRQDHFSEGDLPEFIQKLYYNCRQPPNFSLLDKFDIAGAGACSKRYSDPSFFKTRWENSELRKAEKIREHRKALRLKRSYYCHIRKVNACTYEHLPKPRMVQYSSLSSDSWESYSDISTPQSVGGLRSKMFLKSFLQEENYITSKKPYGLGERKVLPALKLKTLGELLEEEERFESLNLRSNESETDTLFGRFRRLRMTPDLADEVEEAFEINTIQGKASNGLQIIEDNASEEDQIVEVLASESDQTDEDCESEGHVSEAVEDIISQTDKYSASEEDQLVEDIESEADQADEDTRPEEDQLIEDIASEADEVNEVTQDDQLVEDIANEADQPVSKKDVLVLAIASEADQKRGVITSEEEEIGDIGSELDQFLDAMSSMDSESDTESRARIELLHDITKGSTDPENIPEVQHPSKNEGWEEERGDLSVHEFDDISEHQLRSMTLSIFTVTSHSTPPSHTLNYSMDEDEDACEDDQADNEFWISMGKFAKTVGGIHVQDNHVPLVSLKDTLDLASEQAIDPSPWHLSYDDSSSPTITATQVNQESPVHFLLPEWITHSREQSSETSHEQDILERERCNSLASRSAPCARIAAGSSFLSKEAEDTKNRCPGQNSPGSPDIFVRTFPQLHSNNQCLARRSLQFIEATANTKIHRMSESSHSSSSMPGSSPSIAEANPRSSSASSVSSVSSPKSPIFSALHSPPISPAASSYPESLELGRKAGFCSLRSHFPSPVPKLLPSPSLKAKPPPPPPPLPALKLNSKLPSNTTGQLNKSLQAPPPPPLPPPPPPAPPPLRMHSKLVQPLSRVHLGSRSMLLGQRHDDLIKSISAYDRSKLKKVNIERSPKAKFKDDRDLLLEQIKNKSLRPIAAMKCQNADNAKAAILEKANAIRQAFAGSDEEDTLEEWTEAQT